MMINDFDDNGNFACVFECTIVNLAMYRQFANAAWDWIIQTKDKTKKEETKQKKRERKKEKTSKLY